MERALHGTNGGGGVEEKVVRGWRRREERREKTEIEREEAKEVIREMKEAK